MTIPLNYSVTVLEEKTVLSSWNWLKEHINLRPKPQTTNCIFDRKLWSNASQVSPLVPNGDFPKILAHMYLTSQLGDRKLIVEIVNKNAGSDIVVYSSTLDEEIAVVINSSERFRDHLSEHLAFWVYLATIAKTSTPWRVARSMPNFQPEDKGPDGISILLNSPDDKGIVEVHSVKNSMNNPKALVSTGTLRNKGTAADHKKLLDEFWLCAHKGRGLGRLDRQLEEVLNQLSISPEKSLRMALLAECRYDAAIIANDKYANIDLFTGFEHVVNDINRRIATYIGSTCWVDVAEQTRISVISILKSAGVL